MLGSNFVTPSSSLAVGTFFRFRKLETVRNTIPVGRPKLSLLPKEAFVCLGLATGFEPASK